jgi:hypothetical protein
VGWSKLEICIKKTYFCNIIVGSFGLRGRVSQDERTAAAAASRTFYFLQFSARLPYLAAKHIQATAAAVRSFHSDLGTSGPEKNPQSLFALSKIGRLTSSKVVSFRRRAGGWAGDQPVSASTY